MRKLYPFYVPLAKGVLPEDSTIMCEQIMTISQSRLDGKCITLLGDDVMENVDEAIRRSLGLR